MGRDRARVAWMAAGVWIASCGPRGEDTGAPRETSPPIETATADTDTAPTDAPAPDTSPSCLDPQPPFTYRYVAAGNFSSCGITDEGCLMCWGSIEYVFLHVREPSALTYTSVSVGRDVVCGLLSTGHVDCWGTDPVLLARVPAAETFRAIETDEGVLCGITTDGRGLCWGGADPGFPPPEIGDPGHVVDVAVDRHDLCALDDRGDVVCLRRSDFGQGRWRFEGDHVDVAAGWTGPWRLGADGALAGVLDVPPGLADGGIAAVDASTSGVCALRADGTVGCYDGYDGDPIGAAPSGSDFVQVASGGLHGCALRETGEIDCWGADAYGQATPP